MGDYDYDASELWILVLASEKYMPYFSQACYNDQMASYMFRYINVS